ncbi:MAG: DNA-binding protein [Deltaproteobacteria bacterium]|nr:DNA-binding protein [Deltaproteobacteria bacterium]
MKKLIIIFTLGALFILPLARLAYAQAGGPGAPVGRMLDPKTIQTMSGEVVSVDKIPGPMAGMHGRVTFNLKTDKETLPVYLGPDFYLDQQGAKYAAGDKVQVKGSMGTMDGKPTLIAIEVKKGDQTLKLRNERGAPLWPGKGMMKGKGKQQ